MAVDKVQVNGNLLDWGSLSVLLNGDPINGVVAVKYNDKRERSKGYGISRARIPRGRTRGKYSAEASITLMKDSAESVRQRLSQIAGGSSFGDAEFTLTLQWFENGSDLQTVALQKCVTTGLDSSDEENTDPSKEEWTLDPMYIVRNGRTLFDANGGGIIGLVESIASAVESIF